jgi:hypothetical protein
MKKFTTEELKAILKKHSGWLTGAEGGSRAVLTDADLTDADLTDADLTRAVLTRADLTDADLTRAVLTRADLTDAVLTRADLTDADLTRAVLTRADLTGADLTRAVLTGADVPVIEQIDAKILAAIEAGGTLQMSCWHDDSCGTTHCRAGWAITIAGEAGKKLEDKYGPGPAGALIYAASRPGVPVPNFYASNEVALADIRKCAAEEALS